MPFSFVIITKMSKTLVFVGGGASALVGSILIKQSNPELEVLIIEKNNQIGKKLKATGSGRCNIAPITDDISLFHNREFVEKTIATISVKEQLEVLKSIGIYTKEIHGVGHYPISESASSVVKILESKIADLGIKIKLDSKVIEYSIRDKFIMLENGEKIHADYIVFANGGASYSSLGGEDTLSDVFKAHGYNFVRQTPIMTPLKVKENTHRLFGVRLHANVELYSNNQLVHVESGEVQFRKDGISGIVILNISRFVDENKKNKIVINPFKQENFEISFSDFKNLYKANKRFLFTLLPKELVDYGLSRLYLTDGEIEEKQLKDLFNYFSHLTFYITKLFGLEHATVSRGGISINDIDYTFKSKKEKDVYFLGEIIDVDGPCGGYSLRIAINSAIIFANNFKQ